MNRITETITYMNTAFRPLEGLEGYYGSKDGNVLSVRGKEPKLLRPADVGGYTYRLYVSKKAVSLSAAKVAYMATTGCRFSELSGCVCVFVDGVPKAVSREYQGRILAQRRICSFRCNPHKRLEELRSGLDACEAYLTTGNVNPMKRKLDALREWAVIYAGRVSRTCRSTSVEIAEAAISDMTYELLDGKVIACFKDYLKTVISRKARILKAERRKLFVPETEIIY